MANRIVPWGGDDHIVSPNLSETSSVMSFDSILSDKPEASLSDKSASRMAAMAESQPMHTASQVIESNGTKASTSTTTYPETDAADQNGSFVRHNKYFFKDGNVSFLVRHVQL
jgi:hypothetical protein